MSNDTNVSSPLIPVILSGAKATPAVYQRDPAHSETANACRSCNLVEIPADHIVPNRYQPRKNFNSSSLIRLADSIKRHGILQPITVRPITSENQHASVSDQRYEIICGERRYRAGIMAGLDRFECVVVDKTDIGSAELSIIENLLRDDLNIFEQAEAFELLISTFKLTQQDVAARVSLSQSAVANKIRLLRFTQPERAAILDNSLSERHARALLRLSDSQIRLKFIDVIIKDKLNVSATEQLIDNYIKYTANRDNNQSDSSNHHKSTRNVTGIFKDVRVFSNSIEKAADILRKSGIIVETSYADTCDTYVYTIRISKSAVVSRET